MKNKLKILSLFCCIAICFIFGGCATVTYSLIKKDDVILQQIKIELDSEDIENHSADLQDIKSNIESYAKTYDDNMKALFMSNLITLSMGSLEEQVLANLLNKSVATSYYWAGNTFYYDIQFSAIISNDAQYLPVENVYYYFYTGKFVPDDEDVGDVEVVQKDDLFIKMYKETYTTSFDSALCTIAEQKFLEKYESYGFTLEDVAYVYKYGQKYSRLHSDADSITKEDDVYIHTWNLESKDQTISLFRTYANANAWYILAVLGGVLVTVIIIVIAKIKGKKTVKNMDY
ncbi:MAG: hypothetical protein ACI4TX_01370 [Christensenellales bacterium]